MGHGEVYSILNLSDEKEIERKEQQRPRSATGGGKERRVGRRRVIFEKIRKEVYGLSEKRIEKVK